MKILKEHLKKYPSMQINDAVKLIYQGTFGGGHMISDKQKCLDFLKEEYDSVAPDAKQELTEDIGGIMCRVNLAAAKYKNINPGVIGEAFIKSAENKYGDVNDFRSLLIDFSQKCKENEFPFPYKSICEYIDEYEKRGFPPVSHSAIYRELYHPAYRVMKKDIAQEYITKA